MLSFILAAAIAAETEPNPQQKVDMFCAYVVGIKYGTDNVTDDQFRRFTVCREHLIPEDHYQYKSNFV